MTESPTLFSSYDEYEYGVHPQPKHQPRRQDSPAPPQHGLSPTLIPSRECWPSSSPVPSYFVIDDLRPPPGQLGTPHPCLSRGKPPTTLEPRAVGGMRACHAAFQAFPSSDPRPGPPKRQLACRTACVAPACAVGPLVRLRFILMRRCCQLARLASSGPDMPTATCAATVRAGVVLTTPYSAMLIARAAQPAWSLDPCRCAVGLCEYAESDDASGECVRNGRGARE